MEQESNSTTPPVGNAPTQSDQEYIKELRDEAAKWRRQLRETEKQRAELEAQWASDKTAFEKRIADFEKTQAETHARARKSVLEYEAKLLAVQRGAVDPDAAYKLLDVAQIEFDDQGKPKGLDTAIDELLKAKPFLVGAPGKPQILNASPSNPPKQGNFSAAQMRDRKFWNEHRDELMQAAREGRITE
jgi:hypothetical protein